MLSEVLLNELRKRLDAGESVRAIARESGVSQAILSRWLDGSRVGVKLRTADLLADYLGLQLVASSSARSHAKRKQRQS